MNSFIQCRAQSSDDLYIISNYFTRRVYCLWSSGKGNVERCWISIEEIKRKIGRRTAFNYDFLKTSSDAIILIEYTESLKRELSRESHFNEPWAHKTLSGHWEGFDTKIFREINKLRNMLHIFYIVPWTRYTTNLQISFLKLRMTGTTMNIHH